MSLLIKALEQAAKDRKAGRAAAAGASPQPAEPATVDAASGASLEPTLEPPPPRRTPPPAGDAAPPPAEKPASPLAIDTGAAPRRAPSSLASLAASDAQQRARAAAVVQAGGRSQHVIAWLRANPVMMMGAAAAVFGIGFGIYVYLQIAYPGGFMRQAAAPAQQAPVPAPSAPAAPGPGVPDSTAATAAPVSGLPATDAVLAPPGTQPVGPAASSGSIAPAAAPPPASGALSSAALIGSAPPAAEQRASLEPMPDMRRERASERAAERAADRAADRAEAARSASAAPSVAAVGGPAAGRERIAVSPTAAQPRLNPTLSQAYTLLQAGSLDESRALYAKLSQAEPLNVDALLGLAYIAAQENRSEDATKLYLRILQINPRHAVAQGALIGLMGKADPTASESRLKTLLAREPSPFLHFILGNLYADQAQWAQAQQSYFQAHHLEPVNPDYAYNLAVGLDHLRQPKLALNFYRRAEELASAQGRSNFNLSHARERIRALSTQLE